VPGFRPGTFKDKIMEKDVTPVLGTGKPLVTPNFPGMPEELKKYPQWVLHESKIPLQCSKQPASVSDPDTWTFCEHAEAACKAGGFDGPGFVFTKDDPYCGIDLDGCRDPSTGEIAPWAQEIINLMSSYTEVSPSGTGVHIIARAKLPSACKGAGIELYDHTRFFTMTGDHLAGTPLTIEDAQEVATALWNDLTAKQGGPVCKVHPVSESSIDWDADPESIQERVEKLIADDPKFRDTWHHKRGDLGDPSLSAYDLALLSRAVLKHGWSDLTELYLLLRRHGSTTTTRKRKGLALPCHLLPLRPMIG
jgi:putative DNA primase/helicase